MPLLQSSVDVNGPDYAANLAHTEGLLKQLDVELARTRDGGGERYRERHQQRGRLLVRDRIELLVDPASPFLELSSLAAWGTEFEVGAMPPFGIHGHRVVVERCFVGEPEIVFNAGTHTVSLCMHYGDFADVAKPTVGVFGVAPVGTRQHSNGHPRPSRRAARSDS